MITTSHGERKNIIIELVDVSRIFTCIHNPMSDYYKHNNFV